MSFIVVIPARHASTRLPGKPLQLIDGRPMIQHVWECAQRSGAERVVVATDHPDIAAACEAFGGECLMTRDDHPSGTDRLGEVADALALSDNAIVVNVQGDEPLIPAAVIDQVAQNLEGKVEASIATLCEAIDDTATLKDPNAVKVVFDHQGMALYFSRALIPWPRDHDLASPAMPQGNWYRHLGLYAYRAGFLRRYRSWQPAPMESLEALEQLRALYQGERIHVAVAAESVPGGVDTMQDLEAVRRLFNADTSDSR